MIPLDVVVVGSYVQDHCWKTDSFPEVGETRVGTFSTGPGGKGFNQAIACHRQGVRTCFIGAIGNDALGQTAQAFADAEHLICDWDIHDDTPTAASSIVVNERGENLIVVALGANLRLSETFVGGRSKLLADAKLVLCQLETDLAATQAALSVARSANVLTVLNPAPFHPGLTPQLLALADIITPNETEFALLVEHLLGDRAMAAAARNAAQLDDATLAKLCSRLGCATVVVTLGSMGCFVWHESAYRRNDSEAYYRIAAEKVACIDTTGAGDAFNGGLAAGLVGFQLARPFQQAVRHANRVAALSTEKRGTAPAMPSYAEVTARFGAA